MSHVIIILKTKGLLFKKIKNNYENHLSIKQIQESFQHKHVPSLSYTTTKEIKKLLKEVNAKKT